MKNKILKYLFIQMLFTLFISCKSEGEAPQMVDGVPKDAIWAGGVDGGNWFLYTSIDSMMNRYYCKIYNDYSGQLLAKGEFVLRKSYWSESESKSTYKELLEQVDSLQITYYDGMNIYLKSDLILLPDGWIIYPLDSVLSKEQLFEIGIPRSDEIQDENILSPGLQN